MIVIKYEKACSLAANNYYNLSFRSKNLLLNLYDGVQKTSLYPMNYTWFDINYTVVLWTEWNLATEINYRKNFFSPEVANNLKVDGKMNNSYSYMKAEAKTTDSKSLAKGANECWAEAGLVLTRI